MALHLQSAPFELNQWFRICMNHICTFHICTFHNCTIHIYRLAKLNSHWLGLTRFCQYDMQRALCGPNTCLIQPRQRLRRMCFSIPIKYWFIEFATGLIIDHLDWTCKSSHCMFCMSAVSPERGGEGGKGRGVGAAGGEIKGELQDFAQALTFPCLVYFNQRH